VRFTKRASTRPRGHGLQPRGNLLANAINPRINSSCQVIACPSLLDCPELGLPNRTTPRNRGLLQTNPVSQRLHRRCLSDTRSKCWTTPSPCLIKVRLYKTMTYNQSKSCLYYPLRLCTQLASDFCAPLLIPLANAIHLRRSLASPNVFSSALTLHVPDAKLSFTFPVLLPASGVWWRKR
jgi:hypothetical protein